MMNVEKAIQNMRNMVGVYALDKAHLKIDNFCRVYYGKYINNVHGTPEPYYVLAGTIMPDNNGAHLSLIKDPTVDDAVWSEVEPVVLSMLVTKSVA